MTDPEPTTPVVTFDALPLSAPLRESIAALGYVHPTPVQRAVFEPASRGRDLVVQARTGTGKTAAFGLPLVESLAKTRKAQVQALVLCPTRELALQVTRELEGLGKHSAVHAIAIYGGAPMPRQIQAIKDGPPILVGTPGRVLDHLRRGTLDVSEVGVLVLDESDEMLSMGFLPQITDILGHLPEKRQTLLFSATLPPDIRRVADTRLKDPEYLTLSGDQVGALEIDHYVYLSGGDKGADLVKILEIENPESAIVFCNTREETKRVAAVLRSQGYNADWLNADLPQAERESVMRATREGRLRFLVATDVAARGIDISHLTHVINYDFPESPEGYVHRTGRTGRAGRTGTALSLVLPTDIGNLYMLRLTYKLRPVERQLPSRQEERTRAEADLVNVFVEAYAKRRLHPSDLALARRIMTHPESERILAGLLRDHLGAREDLGEEAAAARRSKQPGVVPPTPNAAARPDSNEAPPARRERTRTRTEAREPRSGGPSAERHTSEEGARSDPEPAAPRRTVGEPGAERTSPGREGGTAEIFLNLGERDGVDPGDIMAIFQERGFPAEQIRFVRVRATNTFVGVPEGLLARALEALDGASFQDRTVQATQARSRPRSRRP